MAEKKKNGEQEQSLSQILKVRRDKLKALQEAGKDPFEQTNFVVSNSAQEIKDNFDAMEGQTVTVAGRIMFKRGMGKVSFFDMQDKTGRIQLYARRDEMDEAAFNAMMARGMNEAKADKSRAASDVFADLRREMQ